MDRKKSFKNPPPSFDEEEEQDGLGENDAVEQVQKNESCMKDPESLSDREHDSENTAPSPNVSDFIIKPIVYESREATKPSSKRSYEILPSGTLAKKERGDFPAVVLGLSKQKFLSIKKSISKSEKTGKLKGKMYTKSLDITVTEHSKERDSKRLNELLRKEMLKSGMGNGLAALDVGMRVMKEKMDGKQSQKAKEFSEKRRKLQQQMLELYIKRLELVQEQTKLVLHELQSSKE